MNLDKLVKRNFQHLRAVYSRRDTMLYALGVGACSDPLDEQQLKFVYEERLQALPSLTCVLAHPGFWIKEPDLEVNWTKLVHAEQSIELVGALHPEDEVTGKYRVAGVVDKGPQTGALLYFEKTLYSADGSLLATVKSTYFLRGDGGCGSWGQAPKDLAPVPILEPTGWADSPTLPIAALIYRLSGDLNPLHADPLVARKAGFDRPILHGLCTFGIACQSLIRVVCDNDADRLRSMGARFTKPVFPGETIRTEYWTEGTQQVFFRCVSADRGTVVLDRGYATVLR
jgi:acyl dehydratase